jgi:hypothetical protein
MKIPIKSRTLLWLCASFVSMLIASSAFWIGLGMGIIVDEMQYNPVHDAAWFASRAHDSVLSARWMWTAAVFLAASGAFFVYALRCRSPRTESADLISIANMSTAAIIGLLFCVVIGFFVAAVLQSV